MDKLQLAKISMNVLAYGPDRIVISDLGEAVSSPRAMSQGVTWDVVFIRRDGWTLGAPEEFEGIAYRTWRDEWVAYMTDNKAIPITEYKERP